MDEVSILSAQVEALRRKIDYFNASNMYVQNIICDYCGGEHAYSDCLVDNWFYPSSEQTNFVNDFYRPPNIPYFNTYYSETYYPEWSNQSTSPEFQTQEKENDFEELIKEFITSNEQRWQDQEIANKNIEASLRNLEIQFGFLTNMLLEESNVSNCGTEFEEVENKEKEELIEETPIFTNQKLAPKVIFKIPIAINAPLPFIHRFIKKEENKKEVLETFKKEEISKPLLDANKQVPRYDFLQEFCTINEKLKGNESVSRGNNWFAIPQREFLLEPKDTFEVKRYHNNFHSFFSIDTSNSLGQKFFKF